MVSFDWVTYLTIYPDLVASGITTRKAATEHYEKKGKFENRVCALNQPDASPTMQKLLSTEAPPTCHAPPRLVSIVIVSNQYSTALSHTMQSLCQYVGKYDFEVCVTVLDEAEKTNAFGDLGFPVRSGGVAIARGDVVVWQRGEVVHTCDVLAHAVAADLSAQQCVAMSVFNSPSKSHDAILSRVVRDHGNVDTDFVAPIDYANFTFDRDYYVRQHPALAQKTYNAALSHWVAHGRNPDCNPTRVRHDRKLVYKWKGWLSHPTHNRSGTSLLTIASKPTMESLAHAASAHGETHMSAANVARVASKVYLAGTGACGVCQSDTSVVVSPDISVVMSYFDGRKEQTLRTLSRLETLYGGGKYHFEVIIVDDNCSELERLDLPTYSFPVRQLRISAAEKGDRSNPGPAYNLGLAAAVGKYVVIQNPECYHADDVFAHILDNVTPRKIISYTCFGVQSERHNAMLLDGDPKADHLMSLFAPQTVVGGAAKTQDNVCVGGWLNHATVNPTYYHYCMALRRADLDQLGGFSTDLQHGFCYDDDEFVRRAHFKRFQVVIGAPLVVHQFHAAGSTSSAVRQQRHFKNFQIMAAKSLRMNIALDRQFVIEPRQRQRIPKKAFTFWSGAEFTYLHYLSAESFCLFNPEYSLTIYTDPTSTTKTVASHKGFSSNEQSFPVAFDDDYFHAYLPRLQAIANLEVKPIPQGDVVSNCLIATADFFRLHYLHAHGGIWLDLDILHLKPLQTIIDPHAGMVVHKYEYTDVVTTGILGATSGHPAIKVLLDKATAILAAGPDLLGDYQAIGPSLLTQQKHLFDARDYIAPLAFYPLCWYNVGAAYTDVDLDPTDYVGIHWYNGNEDTRRFLNRFHATYERQHTIDDKTCFMSKLIMTYLRHKIAASSHDYTEYAFHPMKRVKHASVTDPIHWSKLNAAEARCSSNASLVAFDTQGNVYRRDAPLEMADAFEPFYVAGVYVKRDSTTSLCSTDVSLCDGIYSRNGVCLNTPPRPILYVTHCDEFKHGYGQMFRGSRRNSLLLDDRFDVGDIAQPYYENDAFYASHRALITTHDCIRIDTPHEADQSVHWCPHSMCGHCREPWSPEWRMDNFKSSWNMLTLKTRSIPHRIIVLEDMHQYTFRGAKDSFHNGIPNACKFIDTYYNFVIYHYECAELEAIKQQCNQVLKFYCLPHHVDTTTFRLHPGFEKKTCDVLLYGSVNDSYPLRQKILRALAGSDIDYKALDRPDSWHEINNNTGASLSQQINQAHICIADQSAFGYAVCKYFEIAASHATIAGDACPIIKGIFGDNMVHLSLDMTEQAIVDALKAALRDKKRLSEMAATMYGIVQTQYDLKSYNDKLAAIVDDCTTFSVPHYSSLEHHPPITGKYNFHYHHVFRPNLQTPFGLAGDTYRFECKSGSVTLFKSQSPLCTFPCPPNPVSLSVAFDGGTGIWVYANDRLLHL
jgi:hypothetical protein